MRSSTLRQWIWVHKWSSLVSMLFLLMLCITGLPLIFGHEIEDWLDPHPSEAGVAPGTPAPTLGSIVQKALAARPAGHVAVSLFFPEDEPHALSVTTAETARKPDRGEWPGLYFQSFDQRTGEVLKAQGPDTGFMSVMFRLHFDMYAGLPGTLFLGAMGLLLVVAVVSGVVVYTPFMRKLDFATVRVARGPRVLWIDLHNLLGIVTVAWVVVVGGTGVINTLNEPLFAQWRATAAAEVLMPYRNVPPVTQRASMDAVMASARAAAPNREVYFMQFPGTPNAGAHHFVAFTRGTTPLTKRMPRMALIDAQTGKLSAMPDMPWYLKALFLSQPLHFGDYGGLPLKIIWALLTLITIVVLGSGI
ncbi:MAG: hypothetical protein GAK28_04887 [Luteibacter sp.]|uniref:PepSY-associated TM helix domain-containing protein n=1 Tax=Luteibacter sp. TaxID=1886636 RepID=UPI001380F448|nr:PepSY domain-containing protein [Luteibacter sp.]KAF1003191.1 MAG: hypothetical protein GAK28_04887 [Luteibacter sp.]